MVEVRLHPPAVADVGHRAGLADRVVGAGRLEPDVVLAAEVVVDAAAGRLSGRWGPMAICRHCASRMAITNPLRR